MTQPTPDKSLIRDSIFTHLSFLQSIGLKHVFHAESQPEVTQELKSPAAQIQTPKAVAQTNPVLDTAPVDFSSIYSLEQLQTCIGNCHRCKLAPGRTNLVFGVGNNNADLMFVGEGPGADEDEQGEPFVGKAGQLLTKIINSMGFTREQVYIANVVKCRPPENRNPELDEIQACMPFLKKQIELVKPKIIMCLGKFAAQTVLNTQVQITKLRGEFQTINGTLVMPAFHPAYLLRNPDMKRIMWEDCKKVVAKLEELGVKKK